MAGAVGEGLLIGWVDGSVGEWGGQEQKGDEVRRGSFGIIQGFAWPYVRYQQWDWIFIKGTFWEQSR